MPADQCTLEDACGLLHELGYEEAAFTFDMARGRDRGKGVVVGHSGNLMQKAYDAGHGRSWCQQFADDLRAGVFGPPTRQAADQQPGRDTDQRSQPG
jgi:hypothetical protein